MSIIVKCISCGAKNRIREELLSKKVLCGNCETQLPIDNISRIVVLTDQNFESFILNAPKPVLVEFWAEWSPPCKTIIPIMEEFSKMYPSIIVAKIDTEKNKITPRRFDIYSIPTQVLFENGKELKFLTGTFTTEKLESELKEWINEN